MPSASATANAVVPRPIRSAGSVVRATIDGDRLLLGVYDISKKKAVDGNAVLPTLLVSTVAATEASGVLSGVAGAVLGVGGRERDRVAVVVVGGAEVSQVTTGATNIYMGVFRVPAGAQSRPHFHADCESAVYMLAGRLNVRWGEELEHGVSLEPGDMVYVPPRETHLLENPSETEAAEYVVARDAPQEDSVEVPWAR